MTGHVKGEGRAGVAGAVTEMPDHEMPSPPFPGPHNPELARIIAEAHERLGDAEPVSGALFAAGLAYRAGLAEARHAPAAAPERASAPPTRQRCASVSPWSRCGSGSKRPA